MSASFQLMVFHESIFGLKHKNYVPGLLLILQGRKRNGACGVQHPDMLPDVFT